MVSGLRIHLWPLRMTFTLPFGRMWTTRPSCPRHCKRLCKRVVSNSVLNTVYRWQAMQQVNVGELLKVSEAYACRHALFNDTYKLYILLPIPTPCHRSSLLLFAGVSALWPNHRSSSRSVRTWTGRRPPVERKPLGKDHYSMKSKIVHMILTQPTLRCNVERCICIVISDSLYKHRTRYSL